MTGSDTYLTVRVVSEGLYKEKGSRFIAYLYPVTTPDEVRVIIEKVRREYHDARHHCFAYMLGPARQVWRVSDDGEPSGTAGKPILGQINSYGLTNILIIVVRYFGGKLLGVSGLINAYRSAAGSAITNGEIIEKTIRDFYELRFPYTSMNDVMRIIKDEGVDQSDQRFDQTCMLMINFRHSSKERILKLLNRVDGLVSVYSHTA
jgi:uncharacterized YigZ family protein